MPLSYFYSVGSDCLCWEFWRLEVGGEVVDWCLGGLEVRPVGLVSGRVGYGAIGSLFPFLV